MEGPTGSTETGPTGSTDTGPTGPPPPAITLADLMNAADVIRQKEASDRTILETIWNTSIPTLQNRLLQWAVGGFTNAYTIMELVIQPPTTCSDGVSRSLADYIQFCSEKTIQEHVALLQAKLGDITVSFATTGGSILIVVSKA